MIISPPEKKEIKDLDVESEEIKADAKDFTFDKGQTELRVLVFNFFNKSSLFVFNVTYEGIFKSV